MCEKHTLKQLVCHRAHGAAHMSIRHWHGEQSVDAVHTGEKIFLVSLVLTPATQSKLYAVCALLYAQSMIMPVPAHTVTPLTTALVQIWPSNQQGIRWQAAGCCIQNALFFKVVFYLFATH